MNKCDLPIWYMFSSITCYDEWSIAIISAVALYGLVCLGHLVIFNMIMFLFDKEL